MADSGPLSPTRLPVPSTSNSTHPPKKDGSKRRSLLLPRGTMVAAAQRGALSPVSSTKLTRPMTLNGGDMQSLAALSAQFAEEDSADAGSSDGNEEARAAAHARLTGGIERSSNSSLGVFRSQSLRKGAPTKESIRSLNPRAQGRNPSKTTGTSSRPLSTLEETRKPSRPGSVASTSSKSAAESMAPPRTKLPAGTSNSTSLRRTASTASRPARTQSALPTPSSLPSITLPRLTDPRRHPAISDGADPKASTSRPGFSTFQQHYSPRKNVAPKPASSTLIHAQSNVDLTSSLSLDTQFLQARLLQLGILHRETGHTLKSWEDDARRRLGKKFDTVARQCGSVQLKEKEGRKRVNVNALKEWSAGDTGLLAENVQVLAGVVTEVMQLVERDGRVQRLLDSFEEWIAWVEEVWAQRDGEASDVKFIEGLADVWRSEAVALVRRMGGLGRVLDGLEHAREGSSLHALMNGTGQLLEGVVGEMKIVLILEKDIVDREKTWVDGKIRLLETGIGQSVG